jgi:hypothetical protein
MSSKPDGDKTLDDVMLAVSKLIVGVETMYEKIGALEARFDERIGALEARFDGNRRVTTAHGGGTHEGGAAADAEKISAGEFQDGQSYFGKSPEQANGRYSYGSTGSNFGNKDPGTKLERPKFTVKNSFSKTPEGAKAEEVMDSDYLDFFDNYDHYMLTWEALPVNENASYPNKDRVAMMSIPPKYARMLSDRLKLVFSSTELQFMSIAQVQRAVFWKDQTTEQLRTRIGKKLEEEVSTLGSLDILRKIKFNSRFGLIDGVAFADFQHNIKKEVMRIQAGGSFSINKIHLKDIIIEALPDRSFQRELYATFGGTGCLLMEADEFAINLVFERIEARITSVTKQGLRAIVNKATRERELGQFTPKTQKAAQAVEIEAEIQDQVNAALVGDRECRNKGVGSDKLLKCRFLGGEKATCTFTHSASDLALKGKGVSKDVPNPQWLNTGKKAFNIVAGAFEGEDEEDEEHGGGFDDAFEEQDE